MQTVHIFVSIKSYLLKNPPPFPPYTPYPQPSLVENGTKQDQGWFPPPPPPANLTNGRLWLGGGGGKRERGGGGSFVSPYPPTPVSPLPLLVSLCIFFRSL